MRHTGKIEITATALSPIVHGARASGNSQPLRQQDWFYIDPTTKKPIKCRVPFVSGNSIKHLIRDASVRYALDAMGVEDGTLSKAEVDLLFSGGHLMKGGAAIDLSSARKLAELMPPLSLCGFAAGNAMEESRVGVDDLHVVCIENASRVPDDLVDHPMLAIRAGEFRGEDFGTRHDQATKNAGRRWLTDGAAAAVEKRAGDKLLAPKKSAEEDRGDSAQMIYEFGTIVAGSVLWGSVYYADLSEGERAALVSAFVYWSTGRHRGSLLCSVGAKRKIGRGKLRLDLRTSIRIAAPSFEERALIVEGDTEAGRYRTHLRERKDEILAAIHEAVA